MTNLGLTHLQSLPNPKGVDKRQHLHIAVFGINLKVLMRTFNVHWSNCILLTSSPDHVSLRGHHDIGPAPLMGHKGSNIAMFGIKLNVLMSSLKIYVIFDFVKLRMIKYFNDSNKVNSTSYLNECHYPCSGKLKLTAHSLRGCASPEVWSTINSSVWHEQAATGICCRSVYMVGRFFFTLNKVTHQMYWYYSIGSERRPPWGILTLFYLSLDTNWSLKCQIHWEYLISILVSEVSFWDKVFSMILA